MTEANHHSASDVARKLERAYAQQFSRSIYVSGRTDYYRIDVVPQSDDGRMYEVHITFKSGEKYCCAEPDCHFGSWSAHDWQQLRNEFHGVGLKEIGPLKISKVRIIIEQGALFGLRFPGDSQTLTPHDDYRYELGPFDETNPVQPDEA